MLKSTVKTRKHIAVSSCRIIISITVLVPVRERGGRGGRDCDDFYSWFDHESLNGLFLCTCYSFWLVRYALPVTDVYGSVTRRTAGFATPKCM